MECVGAQSRRMLQLPPRMTTVNSELGRLFQHAAQNSSADSDSFFSNVCIRFAAPVHGSDQVMAVKVAFLSLTLLVSVLLLEKEPNYMLA